MASELPPGFTLDQPAQAAGLPAGFTLDEPAQQATGPEHSDSLMRYPAALNEAGLQLTTGAVAAPVAGMAGVLQGAWNLAGRLSGQPVGMSAADRVRQVQGAMTYEPKTDLGQQASGAINYLPQKLAEGADAAGNVVNGVPVVGPALATATNLGIQAIPSILLKAGPKLAAKMAPQPASVRITPTIRAQDYVASHTDLDWNSLSQKVQDTLTDIASDSHALHQLDPKALETQARLESLDVPVPATAGQLSRDPAQLRNEGNVSATKAGQPIRDIYLAQNKALLDNLDVLKGKTGGTADSPAQVGISVQDQALRAKLKAKKAEVSSLYNAADTAGETQQRVSIKPILDLINETPDKTHYGYVQSWIKQMGAVSKETTPAPTIGKFVKGPDGQPRMTQVKVGADSTAMVADDLSIRELEDLRKAAVAKQANGGEDAYYAGKLKEAIDQTTAGAGGDLYKKARAANVEKEREFGDQSAVARLVEQKTGRPLDRATALEDTWNATVKNGSAEDLTKVKKSLLAGGAKGQQAWRDLQAQTIQHIKDEATKTVSTFEDGQRNVTPAAMERAIKSIGSENLKVLFSPEMVGKLDRIMEATRTVKTEPPTGFKGSPTFANILTFLEKSMISKIPLLGDTATGIVKAAANLQDLGKSTREVKAATTTPLDEGIANAKNALAGDRRRNALSNYGRAIPATQQNRQ